ncbi:hypothetical protein WJX77_001933 [Trebouxia sp. C0004]
MFKSKLFEVHHNLFPQYEYAYTKWWKWFKFFINIATAAFAVLAEIFLVGSLGSKAIDTAIPIFLAGRFLECLKDGVTFALTGNLIIFKGFSTPERAARFDRNAKYTSSMTLSLAMAVTAYYGFTKERGNWGDWTLFMLGTVALLDFLIATYVIILDEYVRDHYLSRERPDEFNIDIGMDEADPFNEGEDTHINPQRQIGMPQVLGMKDQRVKSQVWQKIEDNYGLSPIPAFKVGNRDDDSDDMQHESAGDKLI